MKYAASIITLAGLYFLFAEAFDHFGQRKAVTSHLITVQRCDTIVGYVLVQGDFVGSLDELNPQARKAIQVLIDANKIETGYLTFACPEGL